MDYEETFSPVVKPATFRIVFALAVQNGWSLKQLDVSNAFLHGVLKEKVYMAQPSGYKDPIHPDYVCLLHKAIYGLKQAPRAWFDSFTTQLFHLGFHSSAADGNLFILQYGPNLVYLLLYVDDIIIKWNNVQFISQLGHSFDLKDLGKLTSFLGLQIDYKDNGLFVHQSRYALDLLAKFKMLDCKPCLTPSSPGAYHSQDSTPLSDPTSYRSLVGALRYLTLQGLTCLSPTSLPVYE